MMWLYVSGFGWLLWDKKGRLLGGGGWWCGMYCKGVVVISCLVLGVVGCGCGGGGFYE